MHEKSKKAVRLLAAALGVLLLCALFWCAAVLLFGRAELPGRLAEVQSVREYAGTSSSAAAAAFGAELPFLPGSGIESIHVYGEEKNGSALCRADVLYTDGISLKAVRPAGAAYVLAENGMNVDYGKKLYVRGTEGVLCEGENGAVLYFSDTECSYALYAGSVQALETAAHKMQ